MWTEAARLDELAPGGVKSVRLQGREVAVCNCEGVMYAVARRCGHMNAPLEQGALVGTILTCPLHHVQFDVVSGRALSNPVDHDLGDAPLPAPVERELAVGRRLQWKIRINHLDTWPARVRDAVIEVDL
jgi:nitrite reductase/ring-hydroxylating ferredoxin subunit